MRGKAHSDETKAAVMAALLAGQSVSEVAAAYQLDASVVSRWKSRIPATELQAVATKKESDLADLITEYLKENLATLSVQARFFRDTDWLRKQPASEVAVLHGVLTDKAIRILSAVESEPSGPVVGPPAGAADPGT